MDNQHAYDDHQRRYNHLLSAERLPLINGSAPLLCDRRASRTSVFLTTTAATGITRFMFSIGAAIRGGPARGAGAVPGARDTRCDLGAVLADAGATGEPKSIRLVPGNPLIMQSMVPLVPALDASASGA